MRTPKQITRDILNALGVDDATNRERAFIAKIIYRTQSDAFNEAASDLPSEEASRRWYETTRKYGLNGSQI